MKHLNAFIIIYGIIFPLLCIAIDVLLTQMNHGMYGLLFYTVGAFMFWQVWFNIYNFTRILNS